MLKIGDMKRRNFKAILQLAARRMAAGAAAALVCLASDAWAEPVKTHPRLLIRSEDLPNLRARMTPNNDAWGLFKEQVVDKCLRDWKCSATQHYTGAPNYQWVRDSFTDEFGVTHFPTLPNGQSNPDWHLYENQSERPAAPEDDVGEPTGNVRLFSEQYAMIFAFMARLLQGDPNAQAQRAEYLAAAKECLFRVVDQAHLGIADLPWRAGNFAQNDRSFAAESFGLTVDWIYEDLTPLELAKIRKAFLVWAKESNDHVYFAPHQSNGHHGAVNSPELLRFDDPVDGPSRYEVRLALNNHYANHARQLMLYALSFDPKDDVPVAAGTPADGIVEDTAPAGSLTSHTAPSGQPGQWIRQPFGVLQDTIGVWLYLMDYAYRHDGAGGISAEGTQYASNGLGPAALMMAALHTAGQDDPAKWGPQVSLQNHPFWSRMVPAYLAMLTPTPRVPGFDTGENYRGPIFQPPLTGDLETYLYLNNQFIKVIGPMALHDARVNGPAGQTVQAVRYIQRYLAPGGQTHFGQRMADMRSNKTLRDAIYTFLLFDPAAPEAADPRPALQSKTFVAMHNVNGKEMGTVLARSGSTPSDTYFYTHLDWIGIDHIRGDSMTFGLWKNGMWLTKPMTGYGVLQGCSDYRNSLALQNGVPTSSPVGEDITAAHGSQWNYSSLGDPQILAHSFGQNYIYLDMDGTPLYQHRSQPQLREVTHASRRMLWLKPDVLVIHDAAASKQAGFFKRMVVNVPSVPTVSGNVAHATAKEDGVPKAELFVTQLLPAGATMQIADIASGEPSGGEDMQARLITEAPGAPQQAHFLHVLQGANGGVTTPDTASLLASSGGTEFEGTLVGATAVLFKKNESDPFVGLAYSVPTTATRHFITGLSPNTAYGVAQTTTKGKTEIQIVNGGATHVTDSGGVLILGDEPIAVGIAATQAQASETGAKPALFTVTRSGALTQPLTVKYSLSGSATAGADYQSMPGAVTIPANAASATITLVPVDDNAYEGAETAIVTLLPDAAYSVDEGAKSATATIGDDDAPSGGYIQFAGANFSAVEGGSATITVKRIGGSAGAVTAAVTLANGTAGGGDIVPETKTVAWVDGETSDKSVTFGLLDDAVYEGDETASLTLGSVTGQAAAGTPTDATLTIHDNEPAPPGQIAFGDANYTVAENVGQFAIQVARLNGGGGAATVNIAVTGGTATQGSDFTINPSQLAWADGESGAKTVTVTVVNDVAYEGASENFTLGLNVVAGAATIGSPGAATVTINDDDPEPQDYDVGDGFPYPTIGSVPWKILGPGAAVRIHHRATPYHEKILVSGRGTADKPIKVIGVPGPNGEYPVIDGANATSGGSLGYEHSSYTPQQGIIAIARGVNTPAGTKAGHVEISGLEVRGSTGQNYIDPLGVSQEYWSSGGAIYLRGAEHVLIRDCELHHCPNGLVAECYSEETEVNRDVVVQDCWFHHNAVAGSYSGNNLQIEAIGTLVQGCRFDPNPNRDRTTSVVDRSAGAVYRYNRIEGGSYLMELVDPTGAVALITGDPNYGTAHVYGNTFVSRDADGSSLVRFGAGYYSTENFRTLLHFYNNTVVADSANARAVFSLAGPTVTVNARNNILHQTAGQLLLASGSGVVNLAKNWIKAGWAAGNGTINGAANLTTGTDPGFLALAAGDFRIAAGSPCRNLAEALPAILLPQNAVAQEYSDPAGRIPRASLHDLGAFEFFVPPATIQHVAKTANGRISLQCALPPQTNWTVETSADLSSWQPTGAALGAANGSTAWEDPSPNANGAKFYRLKRVN